VVVVQQPLTRGPDVLAAVGGGGEPGVGILQDPAGAVETLQQGSPPPPSPGGAGQALLRRQGLGPLTEMLGAEQLAANRAREQIFACVRTTSEETGEEAARIQRRDSANLGMLADWSAPRSSSRGGGSSGHGTGGAAEYRTAAGALIRAV
jgi:hypothetical protein